MAYDFDDYPPSPTLTNPDLILPDAFPQSSPTRTNHNAKRLSYATNLAISHLTNLNSPEITVRPSSPLSAIDESDSTTPRKQKQKQRQDVFLASSPTLQPTGGQSTWTLSSDLRPASGLSNSSSIHSDDLARLKPTNTSYQFDEPTVDDVEPSSDHYGSSPAAAYATEDYLSRRAEMILANAKKRLNLMEGNLKGARSSLSISSRTSRYSQTSQQSKPQHSYFAHNHSRAASELSLSSPVPALPSSRAQLKRSSSALAMLTGTTPVSPLDRGNSLRGARSQEAMREKRLQNWIMDERAQTPPAEPTTPKSMYFEGIQQSPTYSEKSELKRPSSQASMVSQASEIRIQMNELKDRIAGIKKRVNESSIRTSSMSMRSGDAHSSSSGSGQRRESRYSSTSPFDLERYVNYPVKSVDPPHYEQSQSGRDTVQSYSESQYEDAESSFNRAFDDTTPQTMINDPPNGPTQEEIEDVSYDDVESVSGQTEYFEAEMEIPPTGRHEDRADAFDYEHFILHSAMGSYFRSQRSGSISSDSSVETTRPANEYHRISTASNGTVLGQNSTDYDRNQSSSSLASFATAQEDYDDDDDSGEDDTEEYEEHSFDALDAAISQPAPSHSRQLVPSSTSASPNESSTTPADHFRPSSASIPPSVRQTFPPITAYASYTPQPALPTASASTSNLHQTSMPPPAPPPRKYPSGPSPLIPAPSPPMLSPPLQSTFFGNSSRPTSSSSRPYSSSSNLSQHAHLAAGGAGTRPTTSSSSSGAAYNRLSTGLPGNSSSSSISHMNGAAGGARPTSGLLGAFLCLDAMDAVDPDVVRADRELVEKVVGGIMRACLDMQRTRDGNGRDGWRRKLEEVRSVLELDGSVGRSGDGDG